MDLYDIAIVGGGPAGLFGAYYAGLRGMRTKIIDALPTLGGQLATLYPEKYIYDMPGFPKVLAKDLAVGFTEQAMQYNPAVCLEERVETLASDGEVVTLTTDRSIHHAKSALITAGVGAFQPKTLTAPGVQELEDRGVSYYVRDKAAYAGQRVLVVGGGDSALDWAITLADEAASVTLAHRRDAFRAHEETVRAMVGHPNIALRAFHEVRAVHGADRVEAVTLFHNQTGVEETFACDAVLLFLGFSADLGPIKRWGLNIERNSVTVNDRMETNLPRVFAAGDVTWHDGKLKLIATGVGEAAVAVNFAKAAIDPKALVFPGHSSEINCPTKAIKV
ncbi:MAG TPA: NAD(P)/FAD-dependent oxidoreductase [Armatimonadota bacterium]|jgi:thioredoxin reductase (NADPH)